MPTLEVLPITGAFPQISPLGQVCAQTEGFWELKFLGDGRQIWQDGNAVRVGTPPDGAVVFDRGVPRLAAGNHNFAVSLQPGIIINGILSVDPNGGITRLAHNWMSPEDDVLWTTPYHAEVKDIKHRGLNGVVRTVGTFRHAEYVRMASGLITFKGDGVTYWAVQSGDTYRITRVPSVGEPTTGPVPLRTPEGRWVLEQYATRGGYCLHPVDSTRGYRVIGIDTFNSDAAVINGEIWVVSQQRVGGPVELRKFNLAEERVQLDAKAELDVVPPPRPLFTGAWHHPVTSWPRVLSVTSTLDFVTDIVPLERPSVIASRLIDSADPSKVLGLLVHEPTDVADAIAQARAIKNQWKHRHPTRRVPPVVCHIAARGHEHDPWHTVAKSDVDVWSIDAYFEIPFPADAEASMQAHLAWWDSRLGADRSWIITYQAYDRSTASHQTPEAINEIRRLQPLFLQLAAERLHVKGIAAFSVNRPSGMVTHPEFAAQFERVAAVCAAPLEIAPFGDPDIVDPPLKPVVTFTFTPSAAVLEPGKSVPVQAVATIVGVADTIRWFYHEQGVPLRTKDAENPASDPDHTFRFFRPGSYALSCEVDGPGGSAAFTAPTPLQISPKEGPALPSIEELSLDILRAADWLTYEVYNTDPGGNHPTAGRLIDREIDWQGYKQWLLHSYMRAYRIDRGFDHGTALTYVWGDIYHVLNGEYPPTDPRRHSPPPPPPPPPGEGRLIQGALRIESGAFRDDAGFVLPLFVHAGDLFSRYCRGHEVYVNETLDLFRHAGYQGARVWTVLHGPFWRGREVGPTHTSSYWDRLAEFFHKFRERGLRLVLSQGDLWRESDAFAFADRLRDHLDPLAVAFVDAGNETAWNGQDDPRQLARFVERLQTPIIKSLSSPNDDIIGEHGAAEWAQDPADIHDAHSGAGDNLGNIRRIWNRGYEMAPKRLGIQSEPRGPNRNVSVFRIHDPNILQAMCLSSLLSRQAYVFFSSPGVMSDGMRDGHFDGGERYEDQPGFFEVPRAAAFLPPDIMSWPSLVHGGSSQGSRRIFGVTDEHREAAMRCDHTKSGDGRWFCQVYGPDMGAFQHLRGRIEREVPFGGHYRLYSGTE